MPNFNSRCGSCNAVVTKNDVKCYVCGEPIPGMSTFFSFFRRKPSAKTEEKRVIGEKAGKPEPPKRSGLFSALM
jgi:hypothetical protein